VELLPSLIHLDGHDPCHLLVDILLEGVRDLPPIIVDGCLNLIPHVHIIKHEEAEVFVVYDLPLRLVEELVIALEDLFFLVHKALKGLELEIFIASLLGEVVLIEI